MMKKLLVITAALLLLNTVAFADGKTAADNYFENKKSYVDLENYEWAEPAIYHLAEYGLIQDDNGRVNPQRNITRAEFTRLIIGAFGLYDHEAQCDFEDVSKESEYYPYIASAYKLGIINGLSKEIFGINEYLLRQDLATIIYRTSNICEINFEEKPEPDFTDSDDIDGYAREAVSALLGAKALSGDYSYRFLPKNNANFAEACKILYYIMLKST